MNKAGLKPADVQLKRNRWLEGGPYSLPAFDKAWDDWQVLEPTAWNAASSLVKSANKPSQCLKAASILVNSGLDIIQPVNIEKPARVANLPADVSEAVNKVICVLPRVSALRKEAFERLSLSEKDLAEKALKFGENYAVDADIVAMIEKVNLAKLAEASIVLSQAVEGAHFEGLKAYDCHYSVNTPYGKVIVGGKGDDQYDLKGVALVVDLGGNDSYEGTSVSTVQAVVDVRGNDKYENCGLSTAGVAELFDYSGNDTYQADKAGIGAASFGVSLVYDREGSDSYSCKDFGEGATHCGIGLLIDGKGGDYYYCRSQAQGYGGTKGIGALIDVSGDDCYVADDSKIDNPSPQTPEHNTSLAQGAGFGRREDGGKNLAGGIGLLVDGAGDDSYSCGVFGQGIGYWYSFGALVDMAGNDRYTGVWYTQGSAAHCALGCLIDAGGNDNYLAKMHVGMGQGHDYSIGLLHDAGGIDSFKALGTGSFGTGRWDGLGLFRSDGPATYFSCGAGDSFGYVSEHRPGVPCNGLFWSTGEVVFDQSPRGKPGTLWVQQEPRKPGEIGVGWSDSSKIVPSPPFTAAQIKEVLKFAKLIGQNKEYAKLLVFKDPKKPTKVEVAAAIIKVTREYGKYADSIDRRLKQMNLDLDAKTADIKALRKELDSVNTEVERHRAVSQSFVLVRKLVPAIYRELLLAGIDYEQMRKDFGDWQDRVQALEKRTAK